VCFLQKKKKRKKAYIGVCLNRLGAAVGIIKKEVVIENNF
jgi:hypothetical protein